MSEQAIEWLKEQRAKRKRTRDKPPNWLLDELLELAGVQRLNKENE